jgi:hypothetical protein
MRTICAEWSQINSRMIRQKGVCRAMQVFNPTAGTYRRCCTCHNVFGTAIPGRPVCPRCKAITKRELHALTEFKGAKIVYYQANGAEVLIR